MPRVGEVYAMAFHRILLKLSGEALAGRQGHGFDLQLLENYCQAVANAAKHGGLELAVVVGGGNIFRGIQASNTSILRSRADQMGMLATVINGMALEQMLLHAGATVQLYTATPMEPIATYYRIDSARAALAEGKVVIIAGGTANPYFTTDSAAALRACELGCDLLAKGTRVDGVYDMDPEKHPEAKRYDHLSFQEVYAKRLKVMDLTAFTLCQENNVPIVVFDLDTPDALLRLGRGERVGTLVQG